MAIQVRELLDALNPFIWTNSKINSMGGSVIPAVGSAYDIGSATKPLRRVYADSLIGTISSGADELVASQAGGTAGYLYDKLDVGTGMGKTADSSAVTINISTHTADADAHHARLHSIVNVLDHSIGGSNYDLVGKTSGGVLGLLTPSYDVSADATAILRSNAGVVAVKTLTTVNLTSTGNLTVTPGTDLLLPNAKTFRSVTANTSSTPIMGFTLYNIVGNLVGLTLNSIVSDEIRTRLFVADETRVDRGRQYWAKSYGIVSREFTTPGALNGTVTVYFENSPALVGAIFTVGDWIMFRLVDRTAGLVVQSWYGTVSAYAAVGSDEQSWTFTLKYGTTGYTVGKGAFALDFGVSGQGYIILDVLDNTGAPFIDVLTWTGTDPMSATHTTHVRIGKLKTSLDNDLSPTGWGFFGDNVYLKGILKTNNALMDNDGISIYNASSADFSVSDIYGFKRTTDSGLYTFLQGYWGASDSKGRLRVTDAARDTTLFAESFTGGAHQSIVSVQSKNETTTKNALLQLEVTATYPGRATLWAAHSIDIRVTEATPGASNIVTVRGDVVPTEDAAWDLGTASLRWGYLYVSNLVAGTIAGTTLSGGEWEHSGNMTIDANSAATTTVTITNQGAGVADLSVDRNITGGGLISGATFSFTGGGSIGDNVSVTAGKTIDGIDISDFAANINETAQDAVGTILTDTNSIDLVYTDATPTITANVKLDSTRLLTTDASGVGITNAGSQDMVIVSGSTPFKAGWVNLSTYAGAGIGWTSSTFAIGAGTLITVAADSVGVSNGSAQYQIPVTGATPFTPAWTLLSTYAGAGLAWSNNMYEVGAGTMITVNTNDVQIAAGANYQFIGTGAGTAASWINLSTLAGAGMTPTNGVLNVIAGNGISVTTDAVAAAADATRLVTVDTSGIGITNAGAQYNFITSGASPFKAAWATINSLAGLGLVEATGVLAVGAGTMITVNANDVQIAAGANYQFIGTGAGTAASWINLLTLAGFGLTHTNGVLAVGAGSGITVNTDDVALAWGTPTISTIQPDDAANAGTGTNPARSDHKHAIVAAAPGNNSVDLNTSTEGTGTSFARADHTHQLNVGITPTWTGQHIFQGNVITRHIRPEATDTYDIGTSVYWYNQQFVSQINAVVFAEQTVQLLGGWFIVPKDAGSFAADVASGATTINFGKAMTPNNFVVIKAHDTGGTIKTEYIQVLTLVSGTTYNVTRDLAAAHVTDPAWSSGVPFMVMGTTGNGRIELNAYDTPRISMVTQGATYNAQTELLRIGDLNANWGYVAEIYGVAIGARAASTINLTIEATNGFRIFNNATQLAQWDASGNILIGQVSAGQDNIYITSGAIEIRNNTTARIKLNSDGSGYLANSSISWDTSGNLTVAGNATIAGWTINSTYIAKDTGTAATSSGMSPTDYPFYAGATYANRASAPFRVTNAGAVTATSGAVGGFTLSANQLTTTGLELTKDGTDTYGARVVVGTVTAEKIGLANPGSDVNTQTIGLWAGAAISNRHNAPFRVTHQGAITAISGVVGGFAISDSQLTTTGLELTKDGFDVYGARVVVGTVTTDKVGMANPGSDGNTAPIGLWAGAGISVRHTAPFRVTHLGVLTATSGTIGGWTLASSGLYAGTGSFASPTTGIKIDAGNTKIGIWNASIETVRISSTGGVELTVPTSTIDITRAITFKDSASLVGYLGALSEPIVGVGQWVPLGDNSVVLSCNANAANPMASVSIIADPGLYGSSGRVEMIVLDDYPYAVGGFYAYTGGTPAAGAFTGGTLTLNGTTGVLLQYANNTKLGTTSTGVTVNGSISVATITNSTSVSLQYNGATKLATTSTGVDVSGAFDVTGIITTIRLEADGGAVIVDDTSPVSGVGIKAVGSWTRGLHFLTAASAILGGWGGRGSSTDAIDYLWAGAAYNATSIRVYPATYRVGIGQNVAAAYILDVGGDVNSTGVYRRSGTEGYIFIPITPKDLTDTGAVQWAGAATKTAATYSFDMSAAANLNMDTSAIKGYLILVSGSWAAANQNNWAGVRPLGGTGAGERFRIRSHTAAINSDGQGFVRADANGDIDIVVNNATMSNSQARCVGYFM